MAAGHRAEVAAVSLADDVEVPVALVAVAGVGVGGRCPRWRSSCSAWTSSRSAVTTAPPSSVVIILTGPKLKQVMSPNDPTGRPSLSDPNAWAASSITRRS